MLTEPLRRNETALEGSRLSRGRRRMQLENKFGQFDGPSPIEIHMRYQPEYLYEVGLRELRNT